MTTISYQEADNLSEIDQKQSHFLSAIKQGAMDGVRKGPSSITAAQAILESGWGSSELQGPNNNRLALRIQKDWEWRKRNCPVHQEYV